MVPEVAKLELNTASFQGDSSGPGPGEMFVRLLNLAPPNCVRNWDLASDFVGGGGGRWEEILC